MNICMIDVLGLKLLIWYMKEVHRLDVMASRCMREISAFLLLLLL